MRPDCCFSVLLGRRADRKRRMKNAGFTLVEIMVVVAILMIMTTFVFLSIGTVNSLYVHECTKEISSALAQEKIDCMSKQGKVYVKLYKTSTGLHIDEVQDTSAYPGGSKTVKNIDIDTGMWTIFGKPPVAVTYKTASGLTGTLDSTGIILAFNRSDGSFMTIGQAWALDGSVQNPPDADKYYLNIVITSAAVSRTITFLPETGKFSVSA